MKTAFLIPILFLTFLFDSCSVPLNPNAPFRQRYVLTGIMRSDTSIQYVTISKSYTTANGIDPLSNTQDPYVAGAEVNMWYKDTIYELRDSTTVRVDTSRYKDSVHFYYAKNLRPQPGEYVDIEALLPNGLLLQSTTHLPEVPQYNFFDTEGDRTIPPGDGRDYISILWKPIENTYFQPRIVIEYYIKGSTVLQEKAVPWYYTNQGGNLVPVYLRQTQSSSFNIDLATINKALNEIPQNGLDKSNYTIAGIDIQMIIYDEVLATYYSALETGVDEFTVRLDMPDYSNIQGGYGIFGSYVRMDEYINFTAKYLNDLGYY
jgi:hypothetical protein